MVRGIFPSDVNVLVLNLAGILAILYLLQIWVKPEGPREFFFQNGKAPASASK
jgi:hypothetical protein